MILLPNQLFFAEVEAMLSEGREVQIRMKGHSMRPLLRSERDQVVLTPCTDPARLRPGDVVLFRIIRASGRVVGCDSPGWQLRSRLWLAIPPWLRRQVLRVLWHSGWK